MTAEPDPDLERFDGLTLGEALQLCVRRSFNLSLGETAFVSMLTKKKKPPRSDEVMRLRHIVVRLRQGDLEDHIHNSLCDEDNASAERR